MAEAHEQMRETVDHALEHPERERFRVRALTGLTILAVLVAIAALLVNRAIKDEITASVAATGTRGSLETAQLLKADDMRSAQEIGALSQMPGLPASVRDSLQTDMRADQDAAAVEQSDAKTGNGIDQLNTRLEKQASDLEARETTTERLEYGAVLLEVGLVMGSLGVLAVSRRLLILTGIVGLAGVTVVVSAFFT